MKFWGSVGEDIKEKLNNEKSKVVNNYTTIERASVFR